MRIALLLAFCAGLAGCVGPGVKQSPDKQAIADDVYARIFGTNVLATSGYVSTAGCIEWQGSRAVEVSGVYSYTLDSGWVPGENPMPELGRLAVGDCQKTKNRNSNCECKVISQNGRNMIKVP